MRYIVPARGTRKQLLSRLIRATPVRWYLPNVNRVHLIQHAIDSLSAGTYLEIGVERGQTFSVVRVARKIGVDPIAPHPNVEAALERPGAQYFATTSDDFFERHAAEQLPLGVDVVFIDGLHTFDQTYRDVRNALKVLRPGGVILVHDCLPTSAQEAVVAPSYEEARRINGPGPWTGDGWKAIVAVRAGHLPAHACVLNCDQGVGIVCKGPRRPPLSVSLEEIDALDYDALAANPEKWLGLCRPAQLQAILRELRKTRMTTYSA
jgi:hypothetical protein